MLVMKCILLLCVPDVNREYILLLCVPDVSRGIHIAVVCARCALCNTYCCCVCQVLVMEYTLLLCVPDVCCGINIAVMCARC